MRRTKLLELAHQANAEIQDEGFRVTIWHGGIGVAVYNDGTAHRADIDLSMTKPMTIIESAKALELYCED